MSNVDPCIDCLFVNGIGYNPHPDFCDYYYQCVPSGFVLVPSVRQCPPGEFWDHTRITCAPARTVICPVDPCRFNSSLESHPFPKSCRGYWRCLMGYSWRPACCPAGQTFIPGRGCSDSVFCEDRCPLDPPPAAEPSTLAPCVDKRAVPGDPTSYYQIITSRFEVLRPCSPNTGFSLQTCSCSVIIRPPQTIPDGVCRRFLYLPFNEDLRDHSVNMHSVRVEGPVVLNLDPAFGNVGGGSACFNGNSRLLIYSFAGRDFGKKFLLRFRYRESERNSSTNGVPEALVTNSDCFSPSSINVAFNRTQTTTVGDIRTALSSRELIIENTQTVWKEVEYRYNGTTFVLTVDGVVQSVSAAGNILIAKTALQIAHGCPLRGEMLGFVGYIDEVEVYLDCFPDDR